MKYGCAHEMSSIWPNRKHICPLTAHFRHPHLGDISVAQECSRMKNKEIEKLIWMERLNELNGQRLPIVDKKDRQRVKQDLEKFVFYNPDT